jgi:hypothetical protein
MSRTAVAAESVAHRMNDLYHHAFLPVARILESMNSASLVNNAAHTEAGSFPRWSALISIYLPKLLVT